jgi:hypothetical protein
MFAADATDSAKESEHVLFFQPHAAREEEGGLFLANFVTVFLLKELRYCFSAKRKQIVCISSNTLVLILKKGEEHVWSDKEVLHLRELVKDYFRKSGVPRRKATLYRDLAISMNLKYQNTADYVLLDEAKVKEKFRGIWTSWKKHGPSKDMVFSPLLLVLCCLKYTYVNLN